MLNIFSTALLRRGLAYKGLERYVDAVNDFKSLLEIDPKNKRAKVSLYLKLTLPTI